MKKLAIITFLLIISISVKPQAVLENTYPATSVSHVKLTNYGWVYYYTTGSYTNPTIKIFSIDHVMIKSISLPIPAGCELFGVWSISDELINFDSKIEVLCTYLKTNVSPMQYVLAVYNEEGDLTQSFPNQYYCYIFSLDGNFKLETISIDTTSSIYSLPGTMVNIPESGLEEEKYTVYPNPCQDRINIDYPPTTQRIIITSLDGKTIEDLRVNSSGHIVISTGLFAAGTYIYSITTLKGKTLTGKFLVLNPRLHLLDKKGGSGD